MILTVVAFEESTTNCLPLMGRLPFRRSRGFMSSTVTRELLLIKCAHRANPTMQLRHSASQNALPGKDRRSTLSFGLLRLLAQDLSLAAGNLSWDPLHAMHEATVHKQHRGLQINASLAGKWLFQSVAKGTQHALLPLDVAVCQCFWRVARSG